MTNSYLDRLAAEIGRNADANAVMSDEDLTLYRVYAVLLLAKKERVTTEDVHNAWVAWASEHQPESQNIIPFKELSLHVQNKDQLYVDAIHKVAERMLPMP